MFARFGITGFLAGIVVATNVSAAVAQDSSVAAELERLRRDMNTLQSYVFRSGKKPSSAAGAIPEFASQDSVSEVQRQLQEFRRQMREMNGQFEEVKYRIERIAERMDRLVADVDLRLRALEEGRAVGGAQMSQGSRPTGNTAASAEPVRSKTVITSASSASVPSGEGGLAGGQKAFGVISKSDLQRFRNVERDASSIAPQTVRPASSIRKPATMPKAAAVPSPPRVTAAPGKPVSSNWQIAALPDGTPKEQYDHAYGLLMKRELPKAETTLRAFLLKHPEHELADNAIFWLGETFYARKNYQEAIKVYYDAYRKYPKGNKAPDVLLKLGMSLATIGEKESACSAYEELAIAHPKARPRILGSADRASKSLGCN